MKPATWITRLAFVIVATASAAACANNTVVPTSPTTDPKATVTVVTVTGASAMSSSAQLTASAQFSDSTALDVTTVATWASSNPALATVSSTGTVTAVGTGVVELRATYQNAVACRWLVGGALAI